MTFDISKSQLIPCACGCGELIRAIDKQGKPPRFVKGHHSRGIKRPNIQGKNHPRWKGGCRVKNGYFAIQKADHPRADSQGYVYASILAYEDHYRCCILPRIIMYHKDGNKQNDEPSNLQPLTRSQFKRILIPVKKGTDHYNWKGGRYIHDGYVMIFVPTNARANTKGYVPEHILVMEQKIGRHLSPDEEVHHKDGIRSNNKSDNLELFSSHNEHIKMHANMNISRCILIIDPS